MAATKEAFPLSWPQEWQRVRPQDRRSSGDLDAVKAFGADLRIKIFSNDFHA